MTTSIKNTLIRKVTLGAGALIISTMTLAGAADAKSNISIQLGFGGFHGGHWSGHHGPWGGHYCGMRRVRISYWHNGHKHYKWVWRSYC